uniref:Uncharacterized protein n=1 Tax=Candidatus Kentrum sp. SD TaxID=2126332 RepID=A0A450YST3_9GAMM|nr:MAG: hypothetical protein BECKSD772F_GA0070984_11863 [Candidatus Kentron sp. SD]
MGRKAELTLTLRGFSLIGYAYTVGKTQRGFQHLARLRLRPMNHNSALVKGR